MNLGVNFNPMAFVDNLTYMGQGMLGIFVVMALIALIVYLCTKITK